MCSVQAKLTVLFRLLSNAADTQPERLITQTECTAAGLPQQASGVVARTPPDRQSGGHSRLATGLLRQPLGRAQMPDLGSNAPCGLK